ncbi:ABC transporter permease subunit, partial [Halorubrum sp. SD626R]|uniref:ABC transporter permease subunit n=1 Tax=Halorubrum sp. SD626R TaxID=1419722 RepID=UPI0018EE5322
CVAAEAAKPGVAFGGEPSGAWIWPDRTLCPDGPLAACILTALVGAEGSLAALVDGLPEYPIRRDSVRTGRKSETVERVGEAAAAAGLPLTRSLAGVVLAQTFVASPFVVVTAKAAFESVDRTLEHASRSLGKSRLTTARNVTLPLAGPGILAGVTLAFARAIGEFGATMMMAYYPRTMPVQIWVSFVELGLDNAYPVAILLVLIAATTLVCLNTVASNPWD